MYLSPESAFISAKDYAALYCVPPFEDTTRERETDVVASVFALLAVEICPPINPEAGTYTTYARAKGVTKDPQNPNTWEWDEFELSKPDDDGKK